LLKLELHVTSFGWRKMLTLALEGSVRIAQAIGLTTLSAVAGANFALSAFLVPRILESPTPLLLRQWKHSFEAGKKGLLPLISIGATSFFYLSYQAHIAPNVIPRK
jgi:hypothetical protein